MLCLDGAGDKKGEGTCKLRIWKLEWRNGKDLPV